MFRFLGYLLSILFVCVLVGAISVAYVFYRYGSGLPDYKQLQVYEPPIVTRFYANDGRLFAEYSAEKRVFVPIKEIPAVVKQAFIAAEDKNFYHHWGIDLMGIVRAVFRNFHRVAQGKRVMGASTITQQVARNFLLTETSQLVSLERKIKEAILSLRIEHAYKKDHILELYLNQIYLGARSFGVAAAALNYFDKTLDELTIEEAAFLAGLPKAPSHYDPLKNYEESLARRNYVIERMYEEGYISARDVAECKKKPIKVLQKERSEDLVRSEFFAEEVRRQLVDRYGRKSLYESGLSIRTTLVPDYQEMATRALRQGLVEYDRRHGWRGAILKLDLTKGSSGKEDLRARLMAIQNLPRGVEPWEYAVVVKVEGDKAQVVTRQDEGEIPLEELKWAREWISSDKKGKVITHASDVLKVGDVILVEKIAGQKGKYKLCQIPKVSGAIIAMNPHTGQVVAMSGGFSFRMSQFNRATQAMRQPGSAFKALIYLTALEKGLTPVSIIYDAPITIELGWNLGTYSPKNYKGNFLGPLTLSRALELSRNTCTVRLVHEILGLQILNDLGKRFGLYDPRTPQIAMALGAAETTLLKLTTAYAMLFNGGRRVEATFIDRVQDRRGKNLLVGYIPNCKGCDESLTEHDAFPELIDERPLVTDPVHAYQMVLMLERVVQRGTGIRAKVIGKPIAGKTGTSNDYRDALFVGSSPDLTVGIYVGFDDPMTLGEGETGGRAALPIFVAFMQDALKDKPSIPFRVPSGTSFVRVNADTGLRTKANDPKAMMEAFKPGTEDKVRSSDSSSIQSGNEDGGSSKGDRDAESGGLY